MMSFKTPFYWLFRAIKVLVKFGCLLWASLALYYSNLPWASLRIVLALCFAVFGFWSLFITKKPRMPLVFLLLFTIILVWWQFILPSHDRPWRPEVAVMPQAIIQGDKIILTGFRNFDYRSRNDFTVKYERREVSLSHLIGLDLYISYFMAGPVGHTFVSFLFDNAAPVTISIETRPKLGQTFAPIASLFKQFELIYVVGDERDLVRVRTNYRKERVFLYHIHISPEKARRLFLVYLQRINELARHPEFYHLLSNSCTINIIRYANAAGRVGHLDYRHLLNGWLDSYLYYRGWINTTLPLDELRRRSFINKIAESAGKSNNFFKRIRATLPLEK